MRCRPVGHRTAFQAAYSGGARLKQRLSTTEVALARTRSGTGEILAPTLTYPVTRPRYRSDMESISRASETVEAVVTLSDDELVDHVNHLAACERRASVALTRSSGRRIPAAVRRAVWHRDEGRCAFVGRTGRCSETAFLEFHYVAPYAAGGAATADNVQLRCRAHNQYEARRFFGGTFVRERRPAPAFARI